jgi:hypothetical protein
MSGYIDQDLYEIGIPNVRHLSELSEAKFCNMGPCSLMKRTLKTAMKEPHRYAPLGSILFINFGQNFQPKFHDNFKITLKLLSQSPKTIGLS